MVKPCPSLNSILGSIWRRSDDRWPFESGEQWGGVRKNCAMRWVVCRLIFFGRLFTSRALKRVERNGERELREKLSLTFHRARIFE